MDYIRQSALEGLKSTKCHYCTTHAQIYGKGTESDSKIKVTQKARLVLESCTIVNVVNVAMIMATITVHETVLEKVTKDTQGNEAMKIHYQVGTREQLPPSPTCLKILWDRWLYPYHVTKMFWKKKIIEQWYNYLDGTILDMSGFSEIRVENAAAAVKKNSKKKKERKHSKKQKDGAL